MFKIEKNIPIGTRSCSKYAFMGDMEIGDSFQCGSSLVASMRNYANTTGIKIQTRRIDEHGHRVWRVK